MLQQLTAIICAAAVAAGASSSAPMTQMQTLLHETNAIHARVDAPRDSLSQYRYTNPQGKPTLTLEDGTLLSVYEPDSCPEKLTADEARNEVQWMVRLLRTQYGLYQWSGGDEAFDKAEEAILAALPKTGTIPTIAYKQILIDNFSFIKDCHFQIDDHNFMPVSVVLGNEEKDFYKQNNLFYADAACTRVVQKIDGKAPETMLRRAIGQKGELTWYLYTLANEKKPKNVIIQYADGSESVQLHPTQSLESLPKDDVKYEYTVEKGLPRLTVNEMVFGDGDSSGWSRLNDEKDKQAFLKSTEQIKGFPAAVIDLSHNPGGNGDLPPLWFEQYTGKTAQPNYCTLRIRGGASWMAACYGARTKEQQQAVLNENDAYHIASGLQIDGEYYVGMPGTQFVENPGPNLFVLTSKGTASAAEAFVDILHNLENVLIIGTNTGGVLTNGANYGIGLPYSKMFFQFGECLFYWNPDYFSEGTGMEPDLYLTGERLQERLELFLEQYAGIQETRTP